MERAGNQGCSVPQLSWTAQGRVSPESEATWVCPPAIPPQTPYPVVAKPSQAPSLCRFQE